MLVLTMLPLGLSSCSDGSQEVVLGDRNDVSLPACIQKVSLPENYDESMIWSVEGRGYIWSSRNKPLPLGKGFESVSLLITCHEQAKERYMAFVADDGSNSEKVCRLTLNAKAVVRQECTTGGLNGFKFIKFLQVPKFDPTKIGHQLTAENRNYKVIFSTTSPLDDEDLATSSFEKAVGELLR